MAVPNYRVSKNFVCFDGQSLNNVNGYPFRTRDEVEADGYQIAFKNVAISGYSWTPDLVADAWVGVRRTGKYANSALRNVLLMNGGQTDVWNGDSAATIYADMVTYATSARSAGFDKVLALTLCPNTSNGLRGAPYDGGPQSAFEAVRLALNILLLAGTPTDFDAVVDLAADATFDDTGSAYYVDGVHWTSAGAQAAADLTAPELETLLTP